MTVQWLTWDSVCLVHCGSWVLVQPMAMILYSKFEDKEAEYLMLSYPFILCYASEPKLNLIFNLLMSNVKC